MEVFKFDSYKQFVLARVRAMPNGGHGHLTKMARHIGANPVVVTQVLRGDRNFSEEQALRVSDFLGLQSLEEEYFMRLIAFEKAGTFELKRFHDEALKKLKLRGMKVAHHVVPARELDESAKSVFYSDWIFSALRLLTSIEKYRTLDQLSERLNLTRARTAEIVEFLLSVGLLKKEGPFLRLGTAMTHLDPESRFINAHRRNWRLKGLEALNRAKPDEMFYSAPCTLSVEDFTKFKAGLVELIGSLSKTVAKTQPEVLVCLNIDWFHV